MNVVLAFLAWLGHLVLLVGLHNWITGHDLPRKTAKLVHLAHLLAFLLFPVLLVSLFGPGLTSLFSFSEDCPGRLGVSLYAACCVGVATLWLPWISLGRRRRRDAVGPVHSEVVDLAAQIGPTILGTGRYGRLARLPGNQAFQVEFAEKTLYVPELPAAWDGLTILHLTDLHFHGTPDRAFFRAIAERCAAWEPDIVALTGDIVDSARHHGWILPILGRLRWKCAGLAILGNHDHRHDVTVIRRRLRRIGMKVPENNWFTIQVRDVPLAVIGHEGPWLPGVPNLADCPREHFRLCLSHTPDHIAWARKQGIQLMLAGHVHGGQIRLPMVGSVFVPSKLGRRHDSGTFYLPPTLLHVCRGLSGEYPVRFRCLPEVALLRLRTAPEKDAHQP
ncbi:MAG: metallophosphoesterase [Gemmataceae bacterium]